MSRLDIVIFGATGFTGKAAVEQMTKLIKQYPGMTWGVAGRSQKKLEDMMAEVSSKTGEDLSTIKIIVADVKDEQSLKDMCSQARVVANCCGPYRFYGEPVVKAAIASGTHYVDVSGEPQFIEGMQLHYNKQAADAGVYVVSACGFDSIPSDMGVVFLKQKFEGTLNSVEAYISTELPSEVRKEVLMHGVVHYGTWESLIHGLSHKDELKPLRKQLYPEPLPSFKPKLAQRSVIHKHEGGWCVPFQGADSSIVYRTQRSLFETEKQRPVQFRPYLQLANIFQTFAFVFVSLIMYVMVKCRFTRGLLLSYPRVFSLGLVSHEGPTQRVMEANAFQFLLIGEGWGPGEDLDTVKPEKRLVAKVSGTNPGYGATVVALLLSAFTVLRERDAMPAKGGVYTTGVAFGKTKLVSNLTTNGLKFEIVDNATK